MADKKTISTGDILLPLKAVQLKALLHIPENARGIILFAHGSGSSRLSPRNQYIAKVLQDSQFATLLMDLLTEDEDKRDQINRQYRFNIAFLAERLQEATDWVSHQSFVQSLPIGYFGASTGAAAALIAAAERKDIKAVVSRGGRPDLAAKSLPKVRCPSLFIVGANDFGVLELNEGAFNLLNCTKRFEIVPNATHLFEEPGTLEEVSRLATHWFEQHL